MFCTFKNNLLQAGGLASLVIGVSTHLLNSKMYVCAYLIPFSKILRASGIVKGLACNQSLKALQSLFVKPSKLYYVPTYVVNALPNP